MVTPEQAQHALSAEGYTVLDIQRERADIGHDKYRVMLDGHENPFVASFPSNLERAWGQRTIESLFGGEISLEREANIYALARECGLPAPRIRQHGTFLLENVMPGKTIKEYVSSLPPEEREAAYLDLVKHVGFVFARAHSKIFSAYGDVGIVEEGRVSVDNAREDYTDRLSDILTHNLAWNGHERSFTHRQLETVRAFVRETLDDLSNRGMDIFKDKFAPRLILANLHRGNVYVTDGKITGISQFNFAQAGHPAAEFYNAFWQFADADVAPTPDVHQALLEGYKGGGRTFDTDDLRNRKVMRLLDVNHFLRAATIYATKRDEPMRNRWGKRFKKEIVLPLVNGEEPDYDLFSRIINEKWTPPS